MTLLRRGIKHFGTPRSRDYRPRIPLVYDRVWRGILGVLGSLYPIELQSCLDMAEILAIRLCNSKPIKTGPAGPSFTYPSLMLLFGMGYEQVSSCLAVALAQS
jgi:hypothetical protein